MPGLQAFWCDFIHDERILDALANKCRLKCLGFKCAMSNLSDFFITEISPYRKLGSNLEPQLRILQSLEVLDLSAYIGSSKSLWDNVPASVKIIRFSGHALSTLDPDLLREHLIKLETLRLPSHPRHCSLRSLIPFGNCNLTDLKLSHYWFSSADNMETWFRECVSQAAFPKLTVLELAHSHFVSATHPYYDAISQFIKAHPRLEVLILPEFTREMIQGLCSLLSLRVVGIRFTCQGDVVKLLRP